MEIESDIDAARVVVGEDEISDELFSFEERAEILRRPTAAHAKLRRIVA